MGFPSFLNRTALSALIKFKAIALTSLVIVGCASNDSDDNAAFNEKWRNSNPDNIPTNVGYSKPSPIRYNTQEPTDYETYKQWRAAKGVEDSPEYARFKLWQEFEQFQRWKEAQQATRSTDK